MHEFVSLASAPGKTGTYFYNQFFKMLGLDDYTYQAMACTDLLSTIMTLRRAKGLAGISITMPFKIEVIKYLDDADASVIKHGCCNTIKVNEGRLIGFNTDVDGAEHVISMIEPSHSINILGSGAMGTMLSNMLINQNARMYSRSLGNWEERHTTSDVIINATGVGTSSPGSPLEDVSGAKLVIDLAMKRGKLADQCDEVRVAYVGGLVFYKHQFMSQFKIYTGIDANPEDFDRIANELFNKAS